MTLAPVAFDAVAYPRCLYRMGDVGLLEAFTWPSGITRQTHAKLVETSYQDLFVQPPELRFLLTIRNQMNRVFRGSGAVVQFTVNQRVQATEQANYTEFINALIPPGGEQQVTLQGPSLSALIDSVLFGINLFDVVTAIDNAGTVTKRENFEWYFRVQRERVSRTIEMPSREVFLAFNHAAGVLQATPNGPVVRPGLPPVCLQNVTPFVRQ